MVTWCRRTGFSCCPTASVTSLLSTFVPTRRRGSARVCWHAAHAYRAGSSNGLGFSATLVGTNIFPVFHPGADSCSLRPSLFLSWQVWKREAHEKKANTVHTHPTNRHLFVTVSGMTSSRSIVAQLVKNANIAYCSLELDRKRRSVQLYLIRNGSSSCQKPTLTGGNETSL